MKSNSARYAEFCTLMQGQIDNALAMGYSLQSLGFTMVGSKEGTAPLSVEFSIDWPVTKEK